MLSSTFKALFGALATPGGSGNANPPPPPLAHPHHHPGGGDAAQVMRAHDADGDGKLTEAEIKLLSQGKSTLQSGKIR